MTKRNAERGGTAATDLQVEAEQRAMQVHVHQVAAHDTDKKRSCATFAAAAQ